MPFPLRKRKEITVLTWQARTLLLGICLLTLWLISIEIEPFLAVTKRVPANVLIVEGWIDEDAMVAAARESKETNYQYVATVGEPVADDLFFHGTTTYADLAAARLQELGVPKEKLIVAGALYVKSGRTYESAKAVRAVFSKRNLRPSGINVFTEGAHARRTWAIYEEVFGKYPRVGVIAWTPADHQKEHWWQTSERAKGVISETIGWFYRTASNLFQ